MVGRKDRHLRERFRRNDVRYAKVQARFALRQQVNPILTLGRTRHETCQRGSAPDLFLLWSFPPVGVGEHELDAVLERFPEVDAMRVLDVFLRAIEQVAHKVRQDVDGRFSEWNRREVIVRDMGRGEMLCTQV